MAELSDLQRKYGAGNLTPEQMLYLDQIRPQSGAEIGQRIIRESSPELKPNLNVLQRTAEGARIAGDLLNKYAPKAYEKIPKRVTSLAPFGFVGTTPGFENLLGQSRKDVVNTEVPASFKFIPSVDTMTGEMQPAGFGDKRVKVGKVVEAIKPADLVGLTSAQKVYSNLGYGQAPEPLDVLDTLGLQAGMAQIGKAGFKGASRVARAGAPYVAEGLTDLVSKYGVDPRSRIIPEAPSTGDAIPEGLKMNQEGDKFVLYDASGKVYASGADAKSAIFRANKRRENEAANAARTARREARQAEEPKVEAKPEVKIDTDRNAPLFFNPLLKAAVNLDDKFELLPAQAANSEEILNYLKGYEGVTDDHILFSGIEDYIKAREANGDPVSKHEVIRYLDQNRIRLYEDYKQDIPGTSNLDLDDFLIGERDLNVEDPDSSHIDDLATNEEEWIRDNDYDSILESVTNRYPELDEERIQDKVDEIIADRARDYAYDMYYEDPYYTAERGGYTLSGNRNSGFYLRAPDGDRLRYSNGREYFNDLDEVNDAIQEHLRESGSLGEYNTKFNEREYPQYLMPGGRNYRELNIGLERGSLDKLSGKREIIRDQVMELDNELLALINKHPIISERSPELQAKIENLRERRDTKAEFLSQMENEPYGWTGNHFDEPDLIAQLRLQDYDDVDGKSGTLIDESQSDLHQKGREKGYRGTRQEIKDADQVYLSEKEKLDYIIQSMPIVQKVYAYNADVYRDVVRGNFREILKNRIQKHNDVLNERIAVQLKDYSNADRFPDTQRVKEAVRREMDNLESQKINIDFNDEATIAGLKEIEDQARSLDRANEVIDKLKSNVPDTPFKNNWYHIAMRRAIKDAIDNGKDRVYIPTGATIADRYNYAAAVDEVAYKIKENGNYNVTIKDFNGSWHQNIGNQDFSNIEPKELDSIFGKAVADKMRERYGDTSQKDQLNPEDVTYVINNQSIGEAIDVGGKGFKVWYDERYPNFMKKEAKDFGAKTGFTKIPTPVTNERVIDKVIRSEARKRRISVRAMEEKVRYMSSDERRKFFQDRQEPVFYIEINDAMRKAYGKGRPYARGGLVTDALDAVDDHFMAMKKGGSVPAKTADSEAKNIEPVPILGQLAHLLNTGSEFLKSRPLKEEGDFKTRGAASAVNSALELVDQFFVNDLAKTADRMAYGFPVTSGKGETLKPLPETTGAALTLAPPAAKVASKVAKVAPKVVKSGMSLMDQAAKQGAETVFDMLERYAPQPMYVVPPGKRMSRAEAEAAGLWHPISDLKLRRPYSEMTATTIDNPAVVMPQTKILTPEDLYKKAGFPKIGDRAATGKILTHINDQPLSWPVNLTGGPKYSMANLSPKAGESAAWESGQGKVTTLQNRIKEAAKSADDVLGIYSSGSLQQVDFNTMMSDALAAQLGGSKLTKKAKAAFDKEMRGFIPDFVGIDSPKLREQLLDVSNGVLRTKFVERMGNKKFQEMGFPDIAATRKAISDVDILDDPLGTTGFTIARMDKNRRVVTPTHPSGYPVSMAGEYMGGLEQRIPYNIMFSTKAKQRRLLGADPAGDYRSYELAQPVQIFDQEWLDTVRKYMEQQKKLTGKAEGGTVEAEAVYSPKENLVFVGQEHGKSANLPKNIRDIAEKYGAYYEGSGGDKMPQIGYRGSWDDAAAKSVDGYPEEFLYTLFTNTDVNRQQDALKGKGSIFENILKNQKKFGYFKNKDFDEGTLRSFLKRMGDDVLSHSQMDASEENVRDFLSMGESMMWDRDDTEARRMADRANSFRQDWLLSQPSGVFFVGSDHIQDLKQKANPVKKNRGGKVRGIKITERYSIAPEAKKPKLSRAEEEAFQRGIRGTKWFQQFRDKYGEPPNLNDSSYNYRAAWKAGVRPQDYAHDPEMQHWASVTPSGESLKSKSHPTAWMEDYMQVTGRDPHDPAKMSPEQVKAMEKSLMYRYGNK